MNAWPPIHILPVRSVVAPDETDCVLEVAPPAPEYRVKVSVVPLCLSTYT